MGPHARAHLVDIEGLGDEVGTADVESPNFFLRCINNRDEDHRNTIADGRGLDAATDFVAVHARHHDIKQHQIRRCRPQHQFNRFGPRPGDQDTVVILQGFEQFVDVFRHVVHHQQRGRMFRVGVLGGIEHDRVFPVPLQFELCANAQAQEIGVDRLGYVIGNPQRQATRFISGLCQGCHENNRDFGGRRMGFQVRQNRVTVHAGHFDIEQDQVG